MTVERKFHFVDSQDALKAVVPLLENVERIAVDAEMSGMYSYRTQVCLVQFATATDEIVIDAWQVRDLTPVQGILENPEVRCILHGSVHDVRCMKADFDIAILGLFDTYIAAQLIGLEKLGLSSLVAERFNVEMDKKYQKMDWRKRPLSDAQIEYVRRDVQYLMPLADQLIAELQDKDLVEEANIEFVRVQGLDPQPQGYTSVDWLRVSGRRDLDPGEQAQLRELWLLRDRLAQEYDQPPGRLVRDATLIDLVKQRPRSRAALQDFKGFPKKLAARHSRDFIEAQERGREAGKPPASEMPKRGTAPTAAERRARKVREGALKAWRRVAAEKRQLPTMAILPTYALEDLSRNPPTAEEDLATRAGVGASRKRRYEAAIRKACEV